MYMYIWYTYIIYVYTIIHMIVNCIIFRGTKVRA